MYKVALVQNQSEMANLGYGDARPLIRDLRYEVELYTALNIEHLSGDLRRHEFDAVIFASNALNDQTIREEVLTESFCKAFSEFIKAGRGCLILHQLRFAEEVRDGKTNQLYSFLPEVLRDVKPIARPSTERARDGKLLPTELAKEHVLMNYPSKVVLDEVTTDCLSFHGLKGLYWHYLDGLDASEWETLLYDSGPDGTQRPLLGVSRPAEGLRVVVSALTLDWQSHIKLLGNILSYVVQGPHHTAVVRSAEVTSMAFEYLIEYLRVQKYPLRVYEIGSDLSSLTLGVTQGVHAILILGPHVNETELPQDLRSAINAQIEHGRLKLVSVEAGSTGSKFKGFKIMGRERVPAGLLHEIEIRVQSELKKGYIDGSFFSTVQSLQCLHRMSPEAQSKFAFDTVAHAIQRSNEHDRDGSYDEVFGPSCALLWLRSKYLGPVDAKTKQTKAWVRSQLPEHRDREKVLAYVTLIETNLVKPEERAALEVLLKSQKIEELSEVDLIAYLRGAVAVHALDVIKRVVPKLALNQVDGVWIDLATTAQATQLLLESQSLLKSDPSYSEAIRPALEQAIFRAVLSIRRGLEETANRESSSVYPWENKASTSLKCVEAWLRFEDLIDLPVYEVIDSLIKYSSKEGREVERRNALVILEEIKNENRSLAKQNHKLTLQNKALRPRRNLLYLTTIGFIACAYIIGSLGIGLAFSGPNSSFSNVLTFTFIEGGYYHLTVIITVIGSSLGYVLNQQRTQQREQEGRP
jgi:hypothetical protein